MKTVSL